MPSLHFILSERIRKEDMGEKKNIYMDAKIKLREHLRCYDVVD